MPMLEGRAAGTFETAQIAPAQFGRYCHEVLTVR
jgi:hypothetical protein